MMDKKIRNNCDLWYFELCSSQLFDAFQQTRCRKT